MIVLGLDVETTGLDLDKDNLVELGLVLWDTDAKKPMQLTSILISDCGAISEDSQKIHGISKEDCSAVGIALDAAWSTLAFYWSRSEKIVAHNGKQFDLPFLRRCYERYLKNIVINLHDSFFDPDNWVDTMTDIPYPDDCLTRNLRHVAADHGFLNPFAHRAVFDVLTMMYVVSKYDFQEILRLSKEPSFPIYAVCVPPWDDSGRSSGEARKNGFRWDVSLKSWSKQIRESQWDHEQQRATLYKVRRL